jgi:hypothetical protein
MNTTNDKVNAQGKPTGRRRSCLGCLGRGAIGLLFFLVIILVAGSVNQASASASDLKKYAPPGEFYQVGRYRLQLYRIDEGSPTVILEAGGGSPAIGCYMVQSKVKGFDHVCT